MKFAEQSVVWPEIKEVARLFYEGMQQHKIMIQQCSNCSTHLPPAQLVCDHCGCDDLTWVEADGSGEIYTYVVYHRSFHPAFNDQVPYIVALVELKEGPRLMGQLKLKEGQIYKVGSTVVTGFHKIDKNNELLYFQLEDGDG